VVTGAGKGIGYDLCHKLVKSGAEVIAVTRTQADLDMLQEELGDAIIPGLVDVSDVAATTALLESVGDIDLVRMSTLSRGVWGGGGAVHMCACWCVLVGGRSAAAMRFVAFIPLTNLLWHPCTPVGVGGTRFTLLRQVVNNAGIASLEPFLETNPDSFDEVMVREHDAFCFLV
jgi:NAD(P)-dependent dehydrogenase (short-subunit alcohol dehydrogenase family)